ncbi:MAG: PIN domain-containing protein [Bacteroidota bacterium]|nr:PIN domain-containing protein [Bacteroidota bacterium]
MSGTNYFIDTDAIIALLNGNKVIENAINDANWLGVSVINIVEFLSFSNLTLNDRSVFEIFLQRVIIINLSFEDHINIINTAATFRISYKLKLPDAIIAASAMLNDAVLITNDKQFSTIPNLQILAF